MTAVAPFGENEAHALDQALVELGLGDARLIQGEGAMLPMGFKPGTPQDLPMGTLVECHLSKATVHSSGIASAGVAWALCVTQKETSVPLCRPCPPRFHGRMRNRTTAKPSAKVRQSRLELRKSEDGSALFECAVDEIEAQEGFHGVVLAALILPNSLNIGGSSGPTRSATLVYPVSVKAWVALADWAEVDKATLDFSAVFNNCRCLVNAWIPCGWSCSVNPATDLLTTKFGQKPSMSTLQPCGCKDSLSPSECK